MNKAMLLAVLVTPLVSASGPASAPSSCADDLRTSPCAERDAALRLYAEALSQITTQAVFASTDRVGIVGQMLATWLAAQDPHSGFLTRDEYAAYRAARNGPYAGVGGELERTRDGETLVYPFPQGPAERAGIRRGERLLTINGMPVKGRPLVVLAAWVSGAPGTQVKLEIVDPHGVSRLVSVTRERIDQAALSVYTAGGARIIRLSDFTPETAGELESALSTWDVNLPVIVDLRGCGGGDFYGALDAAMLFLDKGAPIVTVSRREGAQRYASTVTGAAHERPVFLWQDEHTASAAELFIGALTDNARAVSVGRTSAGKGSRQDIVPLGDGSALILTTGYMSTPRGVRFDGRGLEPQRPVVQDASTAVYLQATAAKE